MFNPFDQDDWESVIGEVGRGFTNFGNFVASGSASLIGTIGDGVIGVYKDAAGGFAYALDATQATASDVGSWAEGAAGTVASFSIDAYSQAKQGLEYAWDQINLLKLEPMPRLGPVNPEARSAMKYLLGGSESAVAGWESNARSVGYSMVFNIGCSVQMVGQAEAFSGVYLDRGGNWGYVLPDAPQGSPLPFPSATAEFHMWMVFGDRDRFGGQCRQIGLTLELPVVFGLNVSFTGNVLLTEGFSFLGFHITAEGGLSGMRSNGASLSPTITAPDGEELAGALAEKAGGYDAVVRALNDPGGEKKLIASASLATLPFVRQPTRFVFIQVKGSRRFYDVALVQGDTRSEVYQASLTGRSNQQFIFKDNGDGSFLIQPVGTRVTDAALDVSGSSGENGAPVIQYPRHGNNNQRFQVMSADNGWFYLLNKNSAKVLSTANGTLQDRTVIVQRTWDHGQDQMVRFLPAGEFPSMNRSYALTNVALNQQLGFGTGVLRMTSDLGRYEMWKVEAVTDGSIRLLSSTERYLSNNLTNPIIEASQIAGWRVVPTGDGDGTFTIEREGRNVVTSPGGSLAMSCQEYNIPGKLGAYDWSATGRTWTLPEAGRGLISFVADTSVDDVYVLITSTAGNNSAAYEIILGGWGNTRTAIRRGAGGPEIASAPVGLPARSGQNPLWISLDSATGRIEIGRGLPGTDVFLSFKDPSFLSAARVVTFSSYENAIQYSQVTVLPIPANSSVAIPAKMGAYQWSPAGKVFTLPEAGRGTVLFTANGEHDVHVAISTQDGAGGPLYEIVIGGWVNTRSVLRRGAQGPELAVASSGLMVPGKPNPLWASIDSTTGWIKVGRGLPGQDILLSYQDPTFIPAARYVTFSSWDVPIDYSQVSTLALNAAPPTPSYGYGLWRITEVANVPATNGAYDWMSGPAWRLLGGLGVFSFTIDKNDAYILIGTTGGSKEGSYEIILGGWDNTKSVIRRGADRSVLASAQAGLTAPGGRNPFWIAIDSQIGTIKVGRNAPGQDVFLSVVDPVLSAAAPVGVRYVWLSAYGQPVFFSQIEVSALKPGI